MLTRGCVPPQMLQVAGCIGDAKLGALSFSAELALRKAAAPGLGSSGEIQAEDRPKATRRAISAHLCQYVLAHGTRGARPSPNRSAAMGCLAVVCYL